MVFPILGSRSYRQHIALIPFCSTLPFNKGEAPVLRAILGITDSTHNTKCSIHCNSIKVTTSLIQRNKY